MNQLSQIRTMMRKRRNGLSSDFQQNASNQIAQIFQNDLLNTPHCQYIAAYLSVDNELNLAPLLSMLHSQAHACYLPILHPCLYRGLWFSPSPYTPTTELIDNRYGIPEPKLNANQLVAPWELTLVLVPLVGFSESGYRLGMGGGYYDYSFQFLHTPSSIRPLMIGCAYHCQKLETNPLAQPWDIPLDGVLTEKALHIFNPQKFSG